MMTCQPINTPIYKSVNLSINQGPINKQDKKMMQRKPYAQIVRSIMYVMMCTRPNLAFTVGLVSRFLSNIWLPHWYTVKKITQSIKLPMNLHLCY